MTRNVTPSHKNAAHHPSPAPHCLRVLFGACACLAVLTLGGSPAAAQLQPLRTFLPSDGLGGNLNQEGYGRSVAAYEANKPGVLAGFSGRGVVSPWILDGDTWRRTNPGYVDNTQYGYSVATDGNWAVVGNPTGTGSFRILRRQGEGGDGWVFHGGTFSCSQVENNARCGEAVAMSPGYIAVGAPEDDSNRGSVSIFKLLGGEWTFVRKISGRTVDSDNRLFGAAVALDGNRLVVGAPRYKTNRGQAYFFVEGGGNVWNLQRILKGGATPEHDTPSSSQFGSAVAFHGPWIVVGSHRYDAQHSVEGMAFIFNTNGWARYQVAHPEPQAQNEFGSSVSVRGDIAVISAARRNGTHNQEGAVYTFKWSGGQWLWVQPVLRPPTGPNNTNLLFGTSVSLGPGGILAVGAAGDNRPGAVYVYEYAPQPHGLTVTQGTAANIQMAWHQRQNSNFANYRIFRDGALIESPLSHQRQFTDNNSTPWKLTEYCIESVHSDFGPSRRVCDTGFSVRPPTSITASQNEFRDRIRISWTIDFPQDHFQWFVLWKRPGGQGAFMEVAQFTNAARQYDDTDVPDMNYEYCIEIVGHGVTSTRSCAVGSRLPAIESISATKGQFLDRTRISWTAVAGATQYEVFRDDQSIGTPMSSPFNDMGGEPGVEHEYCVRPIGTSFSPADRACARGGRFSDPPANVSATDGAHEDRVNITWEYVAGFETHFRIRRHELLSGNVQEFDNLGRHLRAYDDGTAVPGRLYRYCVQARNEHVTAEGCDAVAWRRPNGAISGTVRTASQAGTADVFVYTEVHEGYGLEFTQNNQRVDAGNIALHNTSFTIEFWTRRPPRNEFNMVISQGTNTTNNGLQIGFLPDGRFIFAFFGNDLSLEEAESATGWVHWAVTYDRPTRNRTIYRNGELVAQDVAAAHYGGTGTLLIGTTLANIGYRGVIDEVRIWRTVRTRQQILNQAGRLLDGSQQNLLGYWPMDVGAGNVVPDHSGGGNHGTIAGSPVWRGANNNGQAPVYNGGFTEGNGSYTISSVYYGTQHQFTVRPFKISPGGRTSFITPPDPQDDTQTLHSFTPATRPVTLATDSRLSSGIDFTDNTSFSVAGQIRYQELQNQSGNVCYAEGVRFEGAIQQTDAEGRYTLTMPPGPHVIRPIRTHHTFEPPTHSIANLTQNVFDVNFTDLKTAALNLEILGGCDAQLGPAVIVVESVNECFSREVVVDRFITVFVPPLEYNIRLKEIDTGDPTLDFQIYEYFRELGAFAVNLTTPDPATGDIEGGARFVYRSDARLELAGLPESTCPNLPAALRQNQIYSITARVFETYPGGDTCPVTDGTVTFHDGISDDRATTTLALDADGEATYEFLAGTPNITTAVNDRGDPPFQKSLRAVADLDGVFPEDQVRVVVTGARPRLGTFTTVSPEIPYMILRDPPGDRSYSFFEQGQSSCTHTSVAAEAEGGVEAYAALLLGFKFETGTSGFGFHWAKDIEVIGEVRATGSFTETSKELTEKEVCFTASERFQTDAGGVQTGPRADLFLGGALNYLYALADVIDLQACEIVQDTSLVMAPNGFETTFAYSENHIRNTLLPGLETLHRLKQEEGDTRRAEELADAIAVWRQTLDLNIRLKEDAEFVVNRSLNGGAGGITYSETSTQSRTETIDYAMIINAEVATKAGLKIGGSGFEAGYKVNFKQTFGQSTKTSDATTNTVGYHLEESSIGDSYTLDIKTDRVYGSGVFDLRSGTTSCTWEPWIIDPENPNPPRTQRRDLPVLLVGGAKSAERNNVDPNGTASFTLGIQNLSESGEQRQYAVRVLQEYNPDGAAILVNNVINPDFFIPSNQSQQATLTVRRGPEAYIYEDLKLLAYAPCEYQNWASNGAPMYAADTISVTVRFQQPCTPIRIAQPAEGWVLNQAGNNRVSITLTEFDREFPDLKSLRLQYIRTGDQVWNNIPAATFERQSDGTWRNQLDQVINITGNTYTFVWQAPAGLADGEYRFRALADCETLGEFISGSVQGKVDRTPPRVFGRPEPSDGFFGHRDIIGVTFNKAIDCSSLNPDRFMLMNYMTGSRIPLRWTCSADNTRIAFEPFGISMDELNGAILQMSLFGPVDVNGIMRGIRDFSGNLLAETVSWQFQVNLAPIVWQIDQTTHRLMLGKEGTRISVLSNQEGENMAFELTGVPGWLSAEPREGVIPAGGELPITFKTPATLAPGFHEAIIYAKTGDQTVPLRYRVEVSETDPDAPIRQTIPLASGWTWFTPVIAADDMSLDSLLAGLEDGSEHDRIVGPGGMSRYDPADSTWTGDFTELMPGRSYRMYRHAAGTLNLDGVRLAPSTKLDLSAGWNWLGYFPEQALSLSAALARLATTASADDVLKGPGGFSMYDPESGNWYGTIVAMSAARGYRLYRSAPAELRYPSGSSDPSVPIIGDAPAADGMTATLSTSIFETAARKSDDEPWVVSASQFEHDMSVVIGVVRNGESVGDGVTQIAAFVGDEIRGVTQMIYVPSAEQYLAFLSVYSNDPSDEQVTFKIRHLEDGLIEEAKTTLTYAADGVFGRIHSPMLLDVSRDVAVEGGPELPAVFALEQNYPNPFNPATHIRYDVPATAHVVIRIYDVAGREVARLIDGMVEAGRHSVTWNAAELASGVYLYRMEAGDFVEVRRMVLVK